LKQKQITPNKTVSSNKMDDFKQRKALKEVTVNPDVKKPDIFVQGYRSPEVHRKTANV
jgi:hypothetical protein